MKIVFLYSILLMQLVACNNRIIKQNKIAINQVCSTHILNSDFEKLTFDTFSAKQTNRKLVEIEGYLSMNFENICIYQNINGSRYAYWINFSKYVGDRIELITQMSGKKVSLKGISRFDDPFKPIDYLGVIDSVFCIKIIE